MCHRYRPSGRHRPGTLSLHALGVLSRDVGETHACWVREQVRACWVRSGLRRLHQQKGTVNLRRRLESGTIVGFVDLPGEGAAAGCGSICALAPLRPEVPRRIQSDFAPFPALPVPNDRSCIPGRDNHPLRPLGPHHRHHRSAHGRLDQGCRPTPLRPASPDNLTTPQRTPSGQLPSNEGEME